MNNISKLTLTAALAAGGALLTACQDDSRPADGAVRTVHMTVSAERMAAGGAATRTELSETAGGNLRSTWSEADRLTVTDGSTVIGTLGVVKGSITTGADGASRAEFEGDLKIPASVADGTAQFTFIYAGANPAVADGTVTASYTPQAGTISALGDYDLLTGKSEVTIAGRTAWTDKLGLVRSVAFAHFTATGLDIPSDGLTVSVSGANVGSAATVSASGSVSVTEGAITVSTDAQGNFYIALPLEGDTQISPVFATTVDGKEYTCTLTREKVWSPGAYVRPEAGQGVEVNFTQGGEQPLPGEDGTTGPTLEWNGHKYRFAKGNLYYNTQTKQWGIFEECTHYLNAAYLRTVTNTGISTTTCEVIDHFRWGATGIEDAQAPEAIVPGQVTAGAQGSFAGTYWPSTVHANSTITDMLAEQWGRVYDFGRAYELAGRPAGDKRTYITPSTGFMTALFSSAYGQDNTNLKTTTAFLQGCTIKGAGIDGKDVTGLIFIPDVKNAGESFNLTALKAWINSVEGAACSSSMVIPYHKNTGNTMSYSSITLDGVEVLDKLNNALFFAAAGKHNFTGSNYNAKTYTLNDRGYYWTANSGTSSNAYNFSFGGTKDYHWMGYTWATGTYSSFGKDNAMSVRLLVQVD